MISAHQVLVSVKVYSNEGEQLLRALITEMRAYLEISHMSAIYKVRATKNKPQYLHDIKSFTSYEAMSVAIRATTPLDPHELMDRLVGIENAHRSETMRHNSSLNLLLYEDLTMMSPRLTLPHPELHLSAEHAVPAAEAWPDGLHPVLKVNLSQLISQLPEEGRVEFYAQGKSLLDF